MIPTFVIMEIPVSLKQLQVDHVKDTDVLCGSKDTSLGKHPGNKLLREMINDKLDEYDAASTKQQKSKINRSIVNAMREKHGSRFLRQKVNGGEWTIISDQAVRDKVSHAFRFASTQRKKEEEFRKQHISYAETNTASLAAEGDVDLQDSNFAQHMETVHSCQRRILQNMLSQTTEYESNSDAESGMETSA